MPEQILKGLCCLELYEGTTLYKYYIDIKSKSKASFSKAVEYDLESMIRV